MTEGKLVKYAAGCITAAFGVLAVWIFFRRLFPALLPLAAGYGLAVWIRAMGRWAAAHTGDLRIPPVGERIGGMVLAGVVCFAVFWGGYRGLAVLAGQAGELVERAAELWNWDVLPDWIRDRVPESLREKIGSGVTAVVEKGAGWLAGAAGNVITALPGAALAVFLTVASVFYWLADRNGIMASLAGFVPRTWQERIRAHPLWKQITGGVREAGRSVGRWLRAQLSLAAVMFLALSAGLGLLGIRAYMAWAFLIALADLLPLLGAGVVLLPWAGFALLSGRTGQAAGLAVLWLILWLLCQWLEPRLTGRALGVHPYVMLAGMYVCYRLAGVGGMIAGAVVLGAMGGKNTDTADG